MEQKVSTTPKALQAAFGAMPRSRIALETGMHSPWVSRVPVTALMAWPASIFEMERKVAKQVAAPA